jgi:hypothetical protein
MCTPDFGNAQQEMFLIMQRKAANMPGLPHTQKKIRNVSIMQS